MKFTQCGWSFSMDREWNVLNTIERSIHSIYVRVYTYRRTNTCRKSERERERDIYWVSVIGYRQRYTGVLDTLQSAYITASFTRDWTRRHWNFMHGSDRPIGFSGLSWLPWPINIGTQAAPCFQSIRILFDTVPDSLDIYLLLYLFIVHRLSWFMYIVAWKDFYLSQRNFFLFS